MSHPAADPEWSAAARTAYRRAMRVVQAAAWLAPASRRDDWQREWAAELWFRASLLARRAPDDPMLRRLTLRALGALPHALWVRTDELRIDPMLQDLRYALRGMATRPAFAALVIATLALGIGANTAMFSIVHSILIKPLPYERPEELVYMYGSFSQNARAMVSPPDYLDYRARNSAFTSLAARTVFGNVVITGGDAPERVRSSIVSANFFATLGVKPYRGRAFLPEEEHGEAHVAIISYGLWQRRYAGDPNVIGSTIGIDGTQCTIVGIMPPTLDRTTDVQVWQPIPFDTKQTSVRRFHFLRLVGRLTPGTSIAWAQRHMDDIARTIAERYPENEGWHLTLIPYQESVVGNAGPVLYVLLAAVGVVLLIACGNVASLLLARATARSSEMAVRTALGAGRGRLVRQLLTESAVLGCCAGAGGLVLARYLLEGVRVAGEGILPRLAEVEIDGTTLGFTVLLSVVTSLVFGAAPAVHTMRSDLASTMKSLGKASATRDGAFTRDVLVVAQVALSFVLLIGAGLLVRSLWTLQHVDTGFEARHLLTAQVSLPASRYRSRPEIQRFWSAFLGRVRAIPGVEDAAATTLLPLRGGGDTYFYVEGHPPASDAQRMNATVSTVTADYFATLRIKLVTGRSFGAADRGDVPGVTVINQALATRLFGGDSPLGRRLVVDFGHPVTAEIVGVVADVRVYGQATDAPDIMYFFNEQPATGFGTATMHLAARVRGKPSAFVPQVRNLLRSIEPDIPLSSPESMADILSGSVSGERFRLQLMGGFALVALVLAVVGLYGTLSYTVSQRSREIGIRMALGARPGAVFGLIARRGMLLVLLGVGLGTGASVGLTRFIASQLFGTGATDPAVFAAVAFALTVAGAAACTVPAARATRADPSAVLRLT